MATASSQQEPSKSAVKKVATRLRGIFSRVENGESVADGELQQALDIVEGYRNSFAPALQSMNGSLRSYLNTLKLDGRVTQRLKRMPTIIDKLVNREASMNLATMRDIGGCRVILASTDPGDLYELAKRIRKNNADSKLIDYVAQPRRSGYRALHLEVPRQGKIIEVQLRTPSMHNWAETAEAFSDIFKQNFKQDGDSDVQRFMYLLSLLHSVNERGSVMQPDLLEEFVLLRSTISGLLTRQATSFSEEE